MRRDSTTVCLAALATVLAGISLMPVLSSPSWIPSALFVVLLVTAAGVVLRSLTGVPAAVLAGQLVVGGLVLTVLFASHEALFGVIPGPDAVHALTQLTRDGLDGTRRFSTPAPPVEGIRLLICAGILAVAVAVDFLAVTCATSVAAGLPLLALYCVPTAVLPDGASALTFALGALGWLLLLAHDGRLRVVRWGRTLARPQDGSRRRFGEDDLDQLGTGARRLGVLAVAVAIVLPLLLPSLANPLLTSGEGEGSGLGSGNGKATSVNPILTLGQDLTSRSSDPVFTFSTTQADPPPLRMVTDDRFDGETWRSSDGVPPDTQQATGPLPAPDGLASGVVATEQRMTVKVGLLSQQYLPIPYPPRSIDIKGDWVYAADTLDVVSRGRGTRGSSYAVTYLDVQPTTDQLRSAAPAPTALSARYLQLPAGLSPQIAEQARQITDKASTEYDRAVALQDWFRVGGGFTYSTDVAPARGDAVETFLQTKRGYCVQFASAMTVMARELGIPARIAVGFLPGTLQDSGIRAVSLNDAHAWPELYFTGIGWVRFEPTPAVRTGAAPDYTNPVAAPGSEGRPGQSTGTSSPGPSIDPRTGRLQSDLAGGSDVTPAATASPGGRTVPVKVIILLVAVLIALLASPLAAVLARRRRRRRARDAVTRVEAAWADLVEQLDDLGCTLPIGSTPRQAQAEIITRLSLAGPAVEALQRLVLAVEQARYAARPPAAPTLDEDVHEVLRAARAISDRTKRLRARILPRSGTARLLGLSSSAGERLAGVDRRLARTGRSVARAPGGRDGRRSRRRAPR